MKKYKEALWYTRSKAWYTYRDIVHDAYIAWYVHTKKNLFEQDMPLIISFIKRVMLFQYGSSQKTYMWRGQKYLRTYTPIADAHDGGDPHHHYHVIGVLENHDSHIDAHLIELRLRRLLTPAESFVLDRAIEGFSQLEIAEVRNVAPQAVHIQINKVRQKAESIGITRSSITN